MRVIWGSRELESFLAKAAEVNPNYPVTVSKFIEDAKEVEVDGVSDGETTVIGAIMEHVEKAGRPLGRRDNDHPHDHDKRGGEGRRYATTRRAIARELGVKGPFNVQFLVHQGRRPGDRVQPARLEVAAVRLQGDGGQPHQSWPRPSSWAGSSRAWRTSRSRSSSRSRRRSSPSCRWRAPSPTVGVEMRSTGEVACFGDTLAEAMSRALIASGLKIPPRGETGIILADEKSDLGEAKALSRSSRRQGSGFVTTQSLAAALGRA